MNTETKSASGSEFGPDDMELLSRQLAERGFYVLGRMSAANWKPAPSRIQGSRFNARHRP